MKESWLKLYQPITENLKLDMRMNLKSKKVPPRPLPLLASRSRPFKHRLKAGQRLCACARLVVAEGNASIPLSTIHGTRVSSKYHVLGSGKSRVALPCHDLP